MSSTTDPDVTQAKNILLGTAASQQDVHDLAKRLKKKDRFGWARKLLDRARQAPVTDPKLRLQMGQLHALCTYKDPDLPNSEKFDRAEEILSSVEDLQTTRDQETLGLAGAIQKRRFEHDAHKRHLERSLSYYRRGYKVGPATDYGYTGINAAYLLDVLAHLEEEIAQEAGETSDSAAARRQQAADIRTDLVAVLPPLEHQSGDEWLGETWWFLVTVAEAHFGLADYPSADVWLARARALEGVPKWEFETTALQLASIARLHGEGPAGPAAKSLESFLGAHNAAGVETAFAGKMGVALSGGGFRASLFHLGVLARLAELDLLRHVHVLSCVSGGSIVGAHYHLEVKRLLKTKDDTQITHGDYIEIVQRMIRDFVAGVQENVRTRIAANPWSNLRMLFSSIYSRTERAGELFEALIYRRVPDGKGKAKRWVHELKIQPKNAAPGFSPKRDNWLRHHKVPMLVLNATTLNTGHNWQFTGSWMGEPPGAIDSEIDGNQRLRRMYYSEAPEKYHKVRLGMAVGASACVPGLFEPVALAELFPGMIVRLVDGGVHDNQGITSLFEQDCSVILVSDASGQMNVDPEPKGGAVGPLLRTTSISMSRVRDTQFQDLKARRRSSLVKGLMVVHLKKDLDVDPLDWVDCEEPPTELARARSPLTSYGVRKDMQELLAGIRTDLDSFSDIEAYALMTSGYLQTEESAKSLQGFPPPQAPSTVNWKFLELRKPLAGKKGVEKLHAKVKKHLAAGSNLAFKVWKLFLPLKVLAWLLAAAAVVAFGWAWWKYPGMSLYQLTLSDLGWTAAVAVVGALLGKTAAKLIQYKQTLTRIAIGLGMGVLGWVVAKVHLVAFDRLFLRLGKL